jgi:hypothetical protein
LPAAYSAPGAPSTFSQPLGIRPEMPISSLMSSPHPLLLTAGVAAGLLSAFGVFGPFVSTVLLIGCVAVACAPGGPLVALMLRTFSAPRSRQ